VKTKNGQLEQVVRLELKVYSMCIGLIA